MAGLNEALVGFVYLDPKVEVQRRLNYAGSHFAQSNLMSTSSNAVYCMSNLDFLYSLAWTFGRA